MDEAIMNEAIISSDEDSLQAIRARDSPRSAGDPRVFDTSSSGSEDEDMGGGSNGGGGRSNGSGASTPDTRFFEELDPKDMGQFLSDGWPSSGGASANNGTDSPVLQAAREIRAEGEEIVGEDEGDNKNNFAPDMAMLQEHPSTPRSPKRAALKNANEDTDVVEDGSSSNAGIVVMQQAKRKADQLSGCPTGSNLSGVASKKAPRQVAFPSAVAAAGSVIASSGSIQHIPASLQLPGKNGQNDAYRDATNDEAPPQQAKEHKDTHDKDKDKKKN